VNDPVEVSSNGWRARAPVEFTYVGKAPCGCILAAVVDDRDPDGNKLRGAHLKMWCEMGLIVERIPSEDIPALGFGHCHHCPNCQTEMKADLVGTLVCPSCGQKRGG